jgi:hypothetical protein
MKTIMTIKKNRSTGWVILVILCAAAVYIVYTSFIAQAS